MQHSHPHQHPHATTFKPPARQPSLFDGLLMHLHDSELWSDYLPQMPFAGYALALGGAVLGAATFIFSATLSAGALALGVSAAVLLVLPFIAMRVFIWWKKRVLANLRSQMLDPITWRGDEHVLDVACGNGALLNGIATRVPQGRALGIDMWAEHSGGGNYESLWAHARLEKVADKIEFKEADARQLPFADALFDVVTCSRAMHHIVRSQADFDQLIPELFRMLKPNGKIVILDIAHLVEACAARMKKVGMTYEVKDAGKFLSYEMKLVVGKK